KIILVSGQVRLSDTDKPADSRFFGKPLEMKQMITELQEMVGVGALKIIPEAAIPRIGELRETTPAVPNVRSAAQEVLTAENDSLGAGRSSIGGPDVSITSGAVIALAMTMNELCTNTTKFGALSLPTGRVEIGWTIDPATQRLTLTWIEAGGPAVEAPTRRSF